MTVTLFQARRFDGLRIVVFDFDRYKSIGHGRNVEARHEEFSRLRWLAMDTLSFVVLGLNASPFLKRPADYSTYGPSCG